MRVSLADVDDPDCPMSPTSLHDLMREADEAAADFGFMPSAAADHSRTPRCADPPCGVPTRIMLRRRAAGHVP